MRIRFPASRYAGPAAENPKHNTLTPKEVADGRILLFDAETTFGWKIDGEAKVADGVLVLGGEKETTATTTSEFSNFMLYFDYASESKVKPEIKIYGESFDLDWHVKGWTRTEWSFNAKGPTSHSFQSLEDIFPSWLGTTAPSDKANPQRSAVAFHVPAGCRLSLRNVQLAPQGGADL